jgi:hypothetical protein
VATARVELFCSQTVLERVSALAAEGTSAAAAMLAVRMNLRMMGKLLKRAERAFLMGRTNRLLFRSRNMKYNYYIHKYVIKNGL